MSILLDVENLKTYFKVDQGLVKAVDGVSYHIDEGEIIGIAGEKSGCGKSVNPAFGATVNSEATGRDS